MSAETRIPKRLTSGEALPTRLSNDLRDRLDSQEWAPGGQLPTEAVLVETYGVSRATVRQALKTLETQGLIIRRQGLGSFVVDRSMIRVGMEELKSITSTIAEMGHRPGMQYHHRLVRPATPEDLEMFDLEEGAEVVDIRRRILADDVTVAYSYDVLPRWVFPPEFRTRDLKGSVFALLAATNGPIPDRAVAQVHAVSDPDVAWDRNLDEDHLFVLLDQLQYDRENRPFMWTRSYFIEGRFNFSVARSTR